MQLFSIEYDQLTLVSNFANGVYVDMTELRERKRMYDLPLQTAHMYRERMVGLNFRMWAQAAESEEPAQKRRRQTQHHQVERDPPATRKAVGKSKQQSINEAASSGDLSAAINVGAN
jgi:hypothetical protein